MAVDVSVIVGTRPEAIKCASVIHALRKRGVRLRVVATGQHSDLLASALRSFSLSADVNLGAASANPDLAVLTSRLVTVLGSELHAFPPNIVLIQGDTTSALCAALAAFYERLRCAHIEAGLRSGDRAAPWPEEMNRELTDRLCTRHYAPTAGAHRNLLREGLSPDSIVLTGQTGVDAALLTAARVGDATPEELRPALASRRNRLIFATGHRRENQSGGLARVATALSKAAKERADVTVLFAAHPNPAARAALESVTQSDHFRVLEPVSYEASIWLIKNADVIVSDSGGIQEEAPSFGTPVLVTRSVTERPEGLDTGALRLVGTNEAVIRAALDECIDDPGLRTRLLQSPNPYGDGKSGERIADDVIGLLGA